MQYSYVIKNIGHHACLREKEHLFRYRAYLEGKSLTFCTRTCSCARANYANIVRSRDAQCKTKESP